MKSSDTKHGIADVPFKSAGVGMAFTRTCGKCGRPRLHRGGRNHRVLGWIADCCAKPKDGA